MFNLTRKKCEKVRQHTVHVILLDYVGGMLREALALARTRPSQCQDKFQSITFCNCNNDCCRAFAKLGNNHCCNCSCLLVHKQARNLQTIVNFAWRERLDRAGERACCVRDCCVCLLLRLRLLSCWFVLGFACCVCLRFRLRPRTGLQQCSCICNNDCC